MIYLQIVMEKLISKIEKVPRGIQCEKSRKDTTSSVKTGLSYISISPKKGGTEPGVQKRKRSLLASHIRWKCSIKITRYSVKAKPDIKVMKIGG